MSDIQMEKNIAKDPKEDSNIELLNNQEYKVISGEVYPLLYSDIQSFGGRADGISACLGIVVFGNHLSSSFIVILIGTSFSTF